MNTKKLFLSVNFFFLFAHIIFAYPGIHKIQSKETPVIELGKKHMLILTGDNEKLYGVLYFAVMNESSEFLSFKFPVLLPKGVNEFEPRDGVEKKDFLLGDNGFLFIEKFFKPGVNLIGIDFKIPYLPRDRKPLELNLPFDVEELSIATPSGSGLSFEAKDFINGLPLMLSDGEYSGILAKNLQKDSSLVFMVKGLPESHFFAELLGVLIGALSFSVLFFRFYLVGYR
jgi:hypothetical protein